VLLLPLAGVVAAGDMLAVFAWNVQYDGERFVSEENRQRSQDLEPRSRERDICF
jgi:hypothetical protein